jgi:hypothetical protein
MAVDVRGSHRQKKVGNSYSRNSERMIITVCVKIKEIIEKGTDYPWPRPKVCLRCGASKVWGHGHVPAWFDGFTKALDLRRYRCPACGCVIRMKPCGYFKNIQASITTIRSRISHRLRTGRWPPGLSHTRQGHWLRALIKNVHVYFGNQWKGRLIEAFDRLLEQGKIPVTRSI